MEGHLEALGDDADYAETGDEQGDFAGEHDETAVGNVAEGREPGETESPKGWDGMDSDGAP
jgi:hypothetical protein